MMKVKRSYAINLNLMLEHADTLFKQPISGRFRYMVSHNLKVTSNERSMVVEAFPPDPAFVEFENRRVGILRELGFNSQQDLDNATPERREELERKILDLREECKAAVEAEDAIDKSRNEFCEEEVELDLRKVRLDDVPEIVGPEDWRVWNLLLPLVIDPEECSDTTKTENNG